MIWITGQFSMNSLVVSVGRIVEIYLVRSIFFPVIIEFLVYRLGYIQIHDSYEVRHPKTENCVAPFSSVRIWCDMGVVFTFEMH